MSYVGRNNQYEGFPPLLLLLSRCHIFDRLIIHLSLPFLFLCCEPLLAFVFSNYRSKSIVAKEDIFDLNCCIMSNNKIDYNLLKTFSKVLEEGSFTKAAKALNQPKSRVSRAISRLENELGVELIRRTTRKTSSTSIGKEFYKNILPYLSGIDKELTRVNGYQKEMNGTIRISAPQDIAQTILVDIISRYRKRYPGVEVQTIVTNEFLDLTSENIDLTFRAGKLKDSNLIQKKLLDVNFIFVCSKSYTENNSIPWSVSELPRHPYLSFKGMEALWVKSKIPIKPTITSDSIPMLLKMAFNGDGITMLPDYFCKEYIDSGELVRVIPTWKSSTEKIHVLFHPTKNTSKIIRKFIETTFELM